MASKWWTDDDELLAALDDALRAARDMPRGFAEAGKAAYAWRDIDAELATLTYDSVIQADEPALAMSRSEPASLRSLTFTSAEFTIELEVTGDALLGQIVPPRPGRAEARTANGDVVTTGIDEIGCFAIRPIPRGSFRLHCQVGEGGTVLTRWFTL